MSDRLRNVWCAVLGSMLLVTAFAPSTGAAASGFARPAHVTLGDVSLPGFSEPDALTLGPDGRIWFASSGKIGRVNDDGSATEFVAPVPYQLPGVATGPDGNLWFTAAVGQIGRLTPGGVFTMFPIPTKNAAPVGIASDGRGSLWFAEREANKIGEISTAGVLTEYDLPRLARLHGPQYLALGPDGNMWFTALAGSLGRITPAGEVSTFPLPSGESPAGITVGPDGAVWFTDSALGHVGKIQTSPPYTTTEYLPESAGRPGGIAAGADGRLWVRFGRTTNIGAVTTTGTTTFYGRKLYGTAITAGADQRLYITVPQGQDRPARVQAIATNGTFTKMSLPTGGRLLKGLTAGPDGNLWFTEEAREDHGVGRLPPAGKVKEFAVPPSGTSGGWGGITTSPDGNLWFTRPGQAVDRVTPAGVVTQFTVPLSTSSPTGIAAGPDGNLWVTESGANVIWRVTPAGVFTGYPLPGGSTLGITSGPDGAMWFADYANNAIGRITTDGVISEFTLPGGGRPNDVATGPDGNLWYTVYDPESGRIGRMTPDGATITEFGLWKQASAVDITPGPDGNLWFTVFPGAVGRITPAGVVKRFSVVADPGDITEGPDGAIWFTVGYGDRLGRIRLK